MKAFFRLPNEDDFIFIEDQNQGKNQASFISFNGEHQIHFNSDERIFFSLEELNRTLFSINNFPQLQLNSATPKHEEYLLKIKKAIEIVVENQLPKLVISRPILKKIEKIKLAETYLNVCQKYPNALCYVLITDQEIWMGATPEILGKFSKKNNEFSTMSLAGTLPINEEWSDKEIHEQRAVTLYAQDILKEFTNRVYTSETYNHFSGNIKHLRTDLAAKIKPEDLEEIISKLHPTPAVCGIPKEFCKTKILEIENYNRSFYTGYIKLETDEDIYYFVNLRCAQIFQNSIIAYAGGGITKDSIPEKEWLETELKSEAILKNLA